jgi:hypothetical protein
VPSVSNQYTLGATGHVWKDLFVGPGTITIQGPSGDVGPAGTIGTDIAGIIYTKSGFASPTVIVGPQIGTTGAVGGWQLSATGTANTANYDLLFQENIATYPGGLTGPTYSLTNVVRSITGTNGIVATADLTGTNADPKINYTVGLQSISGVSGTYNNPSVQQVNQYGQITSITDAGGGAGSVFNLAAITGGQSLTTIVTAITSTTLTVRAGSNIAVIANSVAESIANTHIYYSYIGITGGNLGAGITSDTSSLQSKSIDSTLQNTVMCNSGPTALTAAKYTITMYGSVSDASGNPTVGQTHIMAFGNMTQLP